jgi:hypothetical protein
MIEEISVGQLIESTEKYGRFLLRTFENLTLSVLTYITINVH